MSMSTSHTNSTANPHQLTHTHLECVALSRSTSHTSSTRSLVPKRDRGHAALGSQNEKAVS